MKAKVHTAQIQSTTENAALDHPAIRNQNGIIVTKGGYSRYKYNPEGVEDVNENTKSGFYTGLGIAIAECELENVQLNRLDICWDMRDQTYDSVYRLGKLLLYCMAVKIGYTKNISDTIDGFNIKKKSVKVQDTKDSGWTFQFELYNKKLQKPNQPVLARLELRRSQLADLKMHELEKVDFVATEFKSILQAIVSDHNNIYSQTIKELNNNLVIAWHSSGETSLRNFINQHIDSFLAKGQIADFIRRVRPDIANVPQKAKRLTDSIGKQMYDKSNLKELVDELIPALQDYLQS